MRDGSDRSHAIKELDAVALLKDLPEHGFVRGQIGAVLDQLAPSVFDVEFSDSLGRMVALVPLPSEKLMAKAQDNCQSREAPGG